MNLVKSIACDISLLTVRNQYFVVEVIRNIAEYCVFGERIGIRHMDSFIERNSLAYFMDIIRANNKFVNM